MERNPLIACVLTSLTVLAAACEAPTPPAPLPPPSLPANPAPPVPNPLTNLAGAYKLTIELPESCTELPEGARRRAYDATLEATLYSYLSIRIVGEGYRTPVVTGDMRNMGSGRVSIDWNNFDIGGCDGWPEPLPDGRTLMICGRGIGETDDSAIAANLTGQVFIATAEERQLICSGTYPFTFRRAATDVMTR